MRPKVIPPTGEPVVGEAGQTHDEIIEQHDLPKDSKRAFDLDGETVDREDAAKLTGIETKQEPGKLHSEELAKAQEDLTKQPTTGEPNATQTRQQPSDSQQQHIGVTPQRVSAETGGGNRPVRETPEPTSEERPLQGNPPPDDGTAPPVNVAPVTAEAVLSRPRGTTTPQEIASLPDIELAKMMPAIQKGQYRLTEDATRWAMNNPTADVSQLEALRDQMKQRKTMESAGFSQWFGDAIHALKKTDQGVKNIASVQKIDESARVVQKENVAGRETPATEAAKSKRRVHVRPRSQSSQRRRRRG